MLFHLLLLLNLQAIESIELDSVFVRVHREVLLHSTLIGTWGK